MVCHSKEINKKEWEEREKWRKEGKKKIIKKIKLTQIGGKTVKFPQTKECELVKKMAQIGDRLHLAEHKVDKDIRYLFINY